MEQTINLFSKGLQLDTNPMVQSNDTLSDALNATFITQNGNEVVLLNDMGNRRVDNAYLPAGYEPVGMKEYGGIIYIAAYNPITGKSQIGSFPSPERRISEMDDNTLGPKEISYDIKNFPYLTKIYNDREHIRNIGFSENSFTTGDSLMFPLTDKTSLHAGDKFTVYGHIYNCEDISNYHNVYELSINGLIKKLVESPKNRLFTLSLGILNSLNEFVDITKSLVRWEENKGKWEIHKFDETDTDLYKFNYLYFIPELFNNFDLIESINDANFIKERLKIAANTYAYKLVGPLYLKAQLNHFLKFNYTIAGSVDKVKNKFTIQITGLFTYNCPDGIYDDSSEISASADNNYYKYHIQEIIEKENKNIGWFTLNNLDYNNNYNIKTIGETSYNPETNLYTAKITKTYIDMDIPEDHLYKYYLNVYNNNHPYVLENKWFSDGLSDEGVIDIDKLGSGEIELNGWRFFTSSKDKTTMLDYSFYAYSKLNNEYTKLEIQFRDITRRDWSESYELDGFWSKGTLTLNWEEYGLEERSLYIVKLTALSENNYLKKSIYGWILTTELFNDCYNKRKSTYVSNYAHPSEAGKKILDDIAKIKCEVKFDVNNENSGVKYSYLDNTKQNWISTTADLFKLKYTHTYTLDLTYSSNPYIVNELLYPKYIKINAENASIDSITIEPLDFEEENNKILNNYILDGFNSYSNKKIDFGNLIKFNESLRNKNLVGNSNIVEDIILFSDLFVAQAVDNEEIKNIFANANGKLEYNIQTGNNKINLTNFEYTFNKSYGGIHIMGHAEKTNWIVGIKIKNDNYEFRVEDPPYEDENIKVQLMAYDNNALAYVFSTASDIVGDSDYVGQNTWEAILSFLNENFKNCVFVYMFRDDWNLLSQNEIEPFAVHRYYIKNITNYDEIIDKILADDVYYKYNSSSEYYYGNDINFGRVWWNTGDGRWALVNGLLSRKDENTMVPNLTKFISKTLFNLDDFIYCYRSSLLPSKIGVYVPSKSIKCYNNKYEVKNKELYLNYNTSGISLESYLIIPDENTYTPEFIYSNESFSRLKIDISFSSSNKLNTYFLQYNGLENIYIKENGQTFKTLILDKNGEGLNNNYIYLIDSNELVKELSENNNKEYKVDTIESNLYHTIYSHPITSTTKPILVPNIDFRLGNYMNRTVLYYELKNTLVVGSYITSPIVGKWIHLPSYNEVNSERVDNDTSHVGNRR